MWKYLSYGIFGESASGEEVFTMAFTKQAEKSAYL